MEGGDLSDEDQDKFRSMSELRLAGVTVGALVSAIEAHGIWSWDRYNRRKPFVMGSDVAKRALEALAKVVDDDGKLESQAEEPDPRYSPWLQCGWWASDLPDFDSLSRTSPQLPPQRRPQPSGRGNGKADNTARAIILSLLKYIEGTMPGVQPHPDYRSQAALIETIYRKMGHDGLSESNLQKWFAAARKLEPPVTTAPAVRK